MTNIDWPLWEVFVRSRRGLSHTHMRQPARPGRGVRPAQRPRPVHPARRGRLDLGDPVVRDHGLLTG